MEYLEKINLKVYAMGLNRVISRGTAMHPLPRPDPPHLRVGAVLLAAGAAARMGRRPKCLLELDGEPLILRLLRAIEGAGVNPPVVVLGHHGQRIAAALHGLAVSQTINHDPDAGQVSSLRLGLRALPDDVDGVMVLLADQPFITAQDLRELMAAYQGRPAGTDMVQPSVEGLPGNPVMFSPSVRAQILAGPPNMGSKQWQVQHPQAVHAWTSSNAHYRTDVDSPEDIESLGMRTGHWLRWPPDPAPTL